MVFHRPPRSPVSGAPWLSHVRLDGHSAPPTRPRVTDESSLRRRDAVMAEQLAHLVQMAELPHVQLHIIPADAGLHVGLSGPLALAHLAEGGWAGHMENQLAGSAVDGEDATSTLLARWEGVRSVALPHALSIALIKEVESRHGPQ
ncbi:Scr1 family TA system antitoxin-like transcriptional regulator [Micromonospora robiginosa]|uniref:Scr1 family TA system antitoxin-like transcriptional regulator n=1 Tax=Micromonospora robiginosa TaxID=2749844 RepID=A0AAF0P5Q5_9ACTN|nr:Scr1 family TA system antitoxin-like transcriptional regulator [Micromonospora ferruginea]WMF04573.1 Scr1 family TA system antitoxin-like transcriptional regulator [Micromonospora ferruginea]